MGNLIVDKQEEMYYNKKHKKAMQEPIQDPTEKIRKQVINMKWLDKLLGKSTDAMNLRRKAKSN